MGVHVPTPRHSDTGLHSERMPELSLELQSHSNTQRSHTCFSRVKSINSIAMLDTNINNNDSVSSGRTAYSDMEAEINSVLADRAVTKASEYRKVIKPLLEKRRRARINHCLTELKELLLETYKADISEPSKLEKADILELTVRHLRELRRQQRVLACRGSPVGNSLTESDEYRSGFTECAHEVSACLSSLPGLDAAARSRLLSHLAKYVPGTCISQQSSPSTLLSTQSTPTTDLLPLTPVVIHPGSLTPPPSPVTRCTTPPQKPYNNHRSFYPCDKNTSDCSTYPSARVSSPCQTHNTETETQPMDLASNHQHRLPTGYVSLAVLMSHKMTETSSPAPPSPTTPVWRPW